MRSSESDKAARDLVASDIRLVILIFTLYMFRANKWDISRIYLVTALRKVKVKRKFYGLRLSGVQNIVLENKTISLHHVVMCLPK